MLPLSPLLPDVPDWPSLAKEAASAWFALQRVQTDVDADGADYWQAYNRMTTVASTITAWSKNPELYGRLKARERILREVLP